MSRAVGEAVEAPPPGTQEPPVELADSLPAIPAMGDPSEILQQTTPWPMEPFAGREEVGELPEGVQGPLLQEAPNPSKGPWLLGLVSSTLTPVHLFDQCTFVPGTMLAGRGSVPAPSPHCLSA